MLKKYKNGFLELLQERGFDPQHFVPTEEMDRDDEVFILRVLDSPLLFKVSNKTGERHLFRCRYVRFLPNFPSTTTIPYFHEPAEPIESIFSHFGAWLQQDVLDYLDDLLTPDLWEQANLQKTSIVNMGPEEQGTSQFSDEEKAQLRLALSEFRLLVKENFKPSQEQMRIIDERLNYVSTALDRLNRFDWRSILISSTLTISVALSLDTARGKLLFELLKRVLSNVLYLLPSSQ